MSGRVESVKYLSSPSVSRYVVAMAVSSSSLSVGGESSMPSEYSLYRGLALCMLVLVIMESIMCG